MTNKFYQKAYCPSCGKIAKSRGKICDANWFAGRNVEQLLPGGELFECKNCFLNFRWPVLSKNTLDHLYSIGYEGSKESNWTYAPEKRIDWNIAKIALENENVDRSILDIGCFDGSFLHFLGNGWDAYGVEINSEAARRASERNIKIISNDYSEISKTNKRFGAVVAMNVIEHVNNPLALLEEMVSLTLPGGLIYISTGNTSAWSWRLLGSNYWYCHLAGHITFINPEWCVNAAQKLEIEVSEIIKFPHHPASIYRKFRETMSNVVVALVPHFLRIARRSGLGGVDVSKFPSLCEAPLGWMTANDHIAVIFKRPENS